MYDYDHRFNGFFLKAFPQHIWLENTITFAPPFFPQVLILEIAAYYMSGGDIREAYVNAGHIQRLSYF